MKISVGGREHIETVVLLVPSNEDAWIEFTANTWNVRINVVFVEDKENSQSRFKLDGMDDHAILTLANWNNSLPMAIAEPFTLGETEGRKIVFLLSGHAVGTLKRIDISFFWEKPNGQ